VDQVGDCHRGRRSRHGRGRVYSRHWRYDRRRAAARFITFDFGKSLTLNRGGRLFTLRFAGDVFAIKGPGAPEIRGQTMADANATQAAVAG